MSALPALIGIMAAAAHAEAVKRVLAPFKAAGATASLAAIEWEPDGKDRRVRVELVKSKILKPHGPGRYWYDQAAHRAAEERQKRTALAVLGAVFATGALALLALR